MKFLLDQCVMGKTKMLLKERGFSIITLKELGKSSVSNSEVVHIAKTHKAILLTHDIDFSDIRLYPPETHNGIIILKTSPQTEDKVHSLLLKALEEVKPSVLSQSLIIIDRNKYRLSQT